MEFGIEQEAGVYTLLKSIGFEWTEEQNLVFIQHVLYVARLANCAYGEMDPHEQRIAWRHAAEFLGTCVDMIRSTTLTPELTRYRLTLLYEFLQMEPSIRFYGDHTSLQVLEGDADQLLSYDAIVPAPEVIQEQPAERQSVCIASHMRRFIKNLRRTLI